MGRSSETCHVSHKQSCNTCARITDTVKAFKGRKPNDDHIRLFRCVCYAKVVDPHPKKLDDRSRMLVHLGMEPGSKAYRLFDPVNRRVVVRRDVLFDEDKCWNWKSCDKGDETGMFTINLGEYGNHGIDKGEVIVHELNEGGEDSITETVTETVTEDQDATNEEGDDNIEHDFGLRRFQRERKRPGYLDDYVLLAELEGERLLLSINDEPWSFDKAKEKKV